MFGERYKSDGGAESGGAVVDQVGSPGLGAWAWLGRRLGSLRRRVLGVEAGPARRRHRRRLGGSATVHGQRAAAAGMTEPIKQGQCRDWYYWH